MAAANEFMVSAAGAMVAVLRPPRQPLRKAEAIRLAAWLVALADPAGTEFPKVLEAVRNT